MGNIRRNGRESGRESGREGQPPCRREKLTQTTIIRGEAGRDPTTLNSIAAHHHKYRVVVQFSKVQLKSHTSVAPSTDCVAHIFSISCKCPKRLLNRNPETIRLWSVGGAATFFYLLSADATRAVTHASLDETAPTSSCACPQ